jgi:hypothetical protein
MMFRPVSPGPSASVSRTFCADAETFRCDSGTIFGREVVPEVCRMSAMSSAVAGPPSALGERCAVPRATSSKAPAAPELGTRSSTSKPSFSAMGRAGDVLPCSTISALARRSVR